jgi:Icc protein
MTTAYNPARRTAPFHGMDTLRLIQFTDTHLLASADAELRGMRTLPSLRACLERAQDWHFPADAVLLSGDLVQDEPRGYDAIRELFAGLNVPVLTVPGNHDLPDALARALGQPPFVVGGSRPLGASWTVRLVSTWYAESAGGEGRVGEQELAALDRDLASLAGRHVLVCLHHPAVPMDAEGIDALGLIDAAELWQIVERHGCVRAIVWGHAHQALDVYRGTRRLMCSPSTCIQFRPRVVRLEVDDRPPGYRVIDLHADGGVSSEVVWLEGYR